MSLFFDCPQEALALKCPSREQQDALADAIRQGAVTWHAAPFNPQYEILDAPLLEYSVEGIARRLDRRFGLPAKRVASLRDVPGLTRAAVPVLARSRVVALSAGVNGFSAPPGVPKNTPFLWRDRNSGAEILYFVHPGGYGGLKRDDGCVTHPKSGEALCTWWNGDNGGPPANASEVDQLLQGVRAEFPEARVVKASTLEAYVGALWDEAAGWEKEKEETGEESQRPSSSSPSSPPPPSSFSSWPGARFFEVVEGEIGDTWIHGIGADVTRVADYRAALRARRAYCRVGKEEGGVLPGGCSGADDPPTPPPPPSSSSSSADGGAATITDADAQASARAVDEFSRMAAKVAEHTWGVAFGPYFGSISNYTNAWLHAGIGWSDDEEEEEGKGGGEDARRDDGAPPGGPPFKPDVELAPNYAAVVRSWRRQYGYLDAARRALMLPASSSSSTSKDGDKGDEGDEGEANAPAATERRHHPILEAWDADVAEREALAADEAFAREAAAAIWQGGVSVEEHEGEDNEAAADGRWRPIWVRLSRRRSSSSDNTTTAATSENDDDGNDDDDDCPRPFPIRLVHWSLAFDRCTGGLTSLRRRRWDAQGAELPPGAEWAGGTGEEGGGGSDGGRGSGGGDVGSRPSHFAELRYDVYGEEDYEPVWREYAYVRPVWVGDFGKLNLTQGLDAARQRRRVGATPELVASFFRHDPPALGGGSRVRLVLRFDGELVREAGAPREAWLDIREPPKGDGDTALLVTAVWRRKTPTRRPEALWLRFAPGAAALVDPSSWRLSKLGGGAAADDAFSVSPFDVVLNGSHAMHAVSDAGVAVRSRSGGAAPASTREVLRIATLDAALVATGAPLPFPIPRRAEPPDLEGEGVSFNLANNVWGTNWPMWSPWRAREVNAAFRFVLTATLEEGEAKRIEQV